ncbi:MAG: hypothetical protein J6D23_03640 [Clostridia bacterium]|nr:hypothetical protein [Clostridia bacterium]
MKEKKPKKIKDKIRRVRSISPMARIVPYIMENRIGSQNFIFDKIYLSKIDKYIKQKQEQGLKSFNLMHVIIAAYVRTCSQRPAINRFIRGQKIYTRRMVEVSLTIKKEMNIDSPDTVVKILVEPNATAEDVYYALNEKIEGYREVKNSSFDKLAKVLNFIPGLLLRWTVRFLRFLDYLGLLPRSLTALSPFHCSFFITSMGSLGIPPIVHHLYDFGSCPTFCSFGAKQRELKLEADGSIQRQTYVEVSYNLDERICDGYYFASALRYLKSIYKSPEILDNPPEVVIEDIR